MNYVERTIDPLVRRTLKRGKSLFLFGARQTGKSTLVERVTAFPWQRC
jgi:phage/plasmid-associated DNA primase